MGVLRFCAAMTALVVLAVSTLSMSGAVPAHADSDAAGLAQHDASGGDAYAGHHAGADASKDCHPGTLCMPAALQPRTGPTVPHRTAQPVPLNRVASRFRSIVPSFDPPPPRHAGQTAIST